MVELWWYGIFLSLLGCSLSNLGVNLQKLVHIKLAEKKKLQQAHSNTKYVTQPLWVVGFLMVIVGSLADLVSFGFASMSLLAPLGAMTLVINMFVAPLFGERLTKRDVACTLIIFAGTIISLMWGSKGEAVYTVKELILMYVRTPFLIYAIMFVLYLAYVAYVLHGIKERREKNCLSDKDKRIEAVIWPSLAGAFGGHSVLFAKSCTEIVKSVHQTRSSPFTNFIPYGVFVGLITSLFLQMRFLNTALSKADALFVVPVYQVCWVIMNTVVGMIYFQDYNVMPNFDIACFFYGVLITLSGVYLLSSRTNRTENIGAALEDSSKSARCSSEKASFLLGIHNNHTELDEDEDNANSCVLEVDASLSESSSLYNGTHPKEGNGSPRNTYVTS